MEHSAGEEEEGSDLGSTKTRDRKILFPLGLPAPRTTSYPDPGRLTEPGNPRPTQQKQQSRLLPLPRNYAPNRGLGPPPPMAATLGRPGVLQHPQSWNDLWPGPGSQSPLSFIIHSPRFPLFSFARAAFPTSLRPLRPPSSPLARFIRKLGQDLLVGRRLAVLGSAPALEEAAEEEGVEDAISSVVPGPVQLQSGGSLGSRVCLQREARAVWGVWHAGGPRVRWRWAVVVGHADGPPPLVRATEGSRCKGNQRAGSGCARGGGRRARKLGDRAQFT